MSDVVELIDGRPGSPLLITVDHASNLLPPGLDVGIAPSLLNDHIAVDIGAGPLARALAQCIGCPALLARFSRLLVDLNRDPDDPNLIPPLSDGYAIPGNQHLSRGEREDRIARYWRPYHSQMAASIDAIGPRMLVSMHSFTPRLASRPDEQRPWEIGILYNDDDRAARIAINLLRAEGVITGDNQPYSGRELNATMNRHGEARGLPYLGIEIRQDLVQNGEGVRLWAKRLAPVIEATAALLPDPDQSPRSAS